MTSGISKPWTETRNGRIVVLAGVVGLFVLVFWLATKSRQMVTGTSALVVDEQYLSVGEVWEDSSFVCTLPIHNTANQEVEIATFATDCTCGKVEPPSLRIPAKGTEEVRLTLDLRNPKNELGSAARRFQVFVQPRVSKGPSPQSGWEIHGTVRSSITFTPQWIDFTDRLVHGQLAAPIAVEVKCHTLIDRLEVAGGEPFVQLRTTKKDVAKGSFLLIVTPSNTIQEGLFRTNATVQPIAKDGTALPKLKLLITGVVLPSVQLTPTRVLLGARRIGDTVTETISVRSLSKRVFAIYKVSSDSKDLIINSLGKDEVGNHKFRLKVPITNEGNHQISTFFLVSGEDQSSITIVLPVNYFGVASERGKK